MLGCTAAMIGRTSFDPITRLENFRQPRPLVAGRRDDGLVRAVNNLGSKPQ